MEQGLTVRPVRLQRPDDLGAPGHDGDLPQVAPQFDELRHLEWASGRDQVPEWVASERECAPLRHIGRYIVQPVDPKRVGQHPERLVNDVAPEAEFNGVRQRAESGEVEGRLGRSLETLEACGPRGGHGLGRGYREVAHMPAGRLMPSPVLQGIVA